MPARKLFFLFITFLSSQLHSQVNDTCLSHTELGISFPPVQVDSQMTFTANHLAILGINKIRFAENWALRQPLPGPFNWGPLETRLNWAEGKNIDVLLTIQSIGPSWVCSGVQNPQSCVFTDNTFFQLYMDSLLTRYGDKIDKIQFGNEWQETFWYAGTANDFIQANNVLYNSVQNNAPHIPVVLGGFTTSSLRWMAGCNGAVPSFLDDDGNLIDGSVFAVACPPEPNAQAWIDRIDSVLRYAQYDMIDLHFYDDVEQWDEYYYNFTDTITKPIIVSEFGGPNINYEPIDQAYQAQRVFQYIKKLDSLQVEEAYFFKLIHGGANPAHETSGLIDEFLNEKEAYYVVQAFEPCPIGIEEYFAPASIITFPNPTTGVVSLSFDEEILNGTVEISNLSGQVLFQKQCTNTNTLTLNLEELNPGLYVVRLLEKTRLKGIGKIIIQ